MVLVYIFVEYILSKSQSESESGDDQFISMLQGYFGEEYD